MVEIDDILANPDNHSKEEILAKLREVLAIKESQEVKGPRVRGKMEGIVTGNINSSEYIFHPKVEEKLTEIADLPIRLLDNALQNLFGFLEQTDEIF